MNKSLFLLFVLIFLASTTYASLIGDDVIIEVFHDGPGTLETTDIVTVIDPGQEATPNFDSFFNNLFDVEITGSTISLIANIDALPYTTHSVVFSDLDLRDTQGNIIASRITNVQVTQNDIISGTIDVSFTDNSVTVFSPTEDAIYNTGGTFTFSIETTPVPEPSSFILLTLCLSGLFVQRKRL